MTNPKFTMNVADIIKDGQKVKVDVSKITVPVYHDRTDVDDESIESLANNMSEVGQLNPVLLDKKSDDHFELISGLRRLEASYKLNWSEIDAIVFENLDESSRSLIMISENAQRENVNDYDLVNSLINFLAVSNSKTYDEIKAFIFKLKNIDSGNVKELSFEEKQLKKNMELTLSRTDKYTLKNIISKIKVISFNSTIIKAMQDHRLLFSYAFQLNKIKDEDVRNQLLNKFISKQLSKQDLKKEIKKAIGSSPSDSNVLPFTATLKKLKDFNTFPEEKQSFVVSKMQEIDSALVG